MLVRYINQQQIQVSPSNQQGHAAQLILQLPRQLTPSNLPSGRYQAAIQQDKGQTLLTLLANEQTNGHGEQRLTLTPQQTKQLLSLPPQALFGAANKALPTLQAKVIGVSANKVEVSFSLNGQQQSVQLRTPQAQSFQRGQHVALQLIPAGQDYQVKLLSQANNTQPPSKDTQAPPAPAAMRTNTAASAHNLTATNSAVSAVSKAAVPTAAMTNVQVATQVAKLSSPQAAPILQAVLKNTQLSSHQTVQLTPKPPAMIASLTKLPTAHQQQAISVLQPVLQKLAHAPVVDIKLNPAGNAQVQFSSQDVITKPQHQIPLTSKQAEQMKALDIPLIQAVGNKNTGEKYSLSAQVTYTDSSGRLAESVAKHQTKTDKAQNPLELKLPPTQSQQQATAPQTTKLSPETLEKIQTLLHQKFLGKDSPTVSLQKVDAALTDPLLTKSPELKQLIQDIKPQLEQLKTQGVNQDASRLQQLLNSPINSVTQANLTSPAAPNHLLSGLITLLQLSLSARASRSSNATFERIQSLLPQMIPSLIGNAQAPATRRSLQDFSQLEQKHQLLKELGRLLSGHQFNKLSSAEQSAQGQETLYYVLPNAMAANNKDIELLVKREPEKQGSDKKAAAQKQIWNLTMKLSVGELGELLSKAKLQETSLELSIYASTEALKTKVQEHLPLLKKRFQQLGIQMDKASCQLGRIPGSLQKKPYQIFQTQA